VGQIPSTFETANFVRNSLTPAFDPSSRKSPQAKIALAELPVVQQISEQIREYLLQQERSSEPCRPQESIDEPIRQERKKWERRLGYFMLTGVAIVGFALNEYFHNKPGWMVLIVFGSGVLTLLGALIYANGYLWVMEKLGAP